MATPKKPPEETEEQPTRPMATAPAPLAPPASENPQDEVPWEGGGGRFIVNGRLVDHEGRPLNKDGSLKREEEA